jgi:hypothetical protein
VNTVDEGFFEKNIPNAYKQRKEHEAEKKMRQVEISSFMLDLITNSNQIVRSKSSSSSSQRIIKINFSCFLRSKRKSPLNVEGSWSREETKKRKAEEIQSCSAFN